MKTVKELMKTYEEKLVEIRRDLHRNPELSFKEFRTTKLIKEMLREMDIEVLELGNETGVVGLLKGKEEGPTIGLRGDIDALPITEENDIPFKSENEGIMHACGHDVHTTSLLGAAMFLSEIRDDIKGQIKFIFQPAEEINEGAQLLIDYGVMENPKIDAVFGLHNHPDIPAGQVGVKVGGLMAAVDTIRIKVKGVGGHGAIPNKTIDPVLTSAAIIQGIQSIVSRNVNPLDSAVVSIGTLKAGEANNVIPEEVFMTGTVRTFNPELRKEMPNYLTRSIDHIAKAYGAEAELEYINHLPAVINDETMAELGRKAVTEICGQEGPVDPTPSMGGEDFALYMQDIPGCFFWLGVGNKEKGFVHQWHHPKFNADEKALPIGAGILTQSALEGLAYFNQKKKEE